jgi:hypothetical protein
VGFSTPCVNISRLIAFFSSPYCNSWLLGSSLWKLYALVSVVTYYCHDCGFFRVFSIVWTVTLSIS